MGAVCTRLESLNVRGDELALVVEHLLEVRHVPTRVRRVPVRIVCKKQMCEKSTVILPTNLSQAIFFLKVFTGPVVEK